MDFREPRAVLTLITICVGFGLTTGVLAKIWGILHALGS